MASRKGSKQKGNKYENEISKKIRHHFISSEVDPKVAYNLVHRTGQSGARTERGDMITQPPLLPWFPYFIECRNRESWSWLQLAKNPKGCIITTWYVEDAVDKCHAYAGKHERYPLLVFTANQHPDYFMAASDHVPGGVEEFLSWYHIIRDVKAVDGRYIGHVIIGLFDEFLMNHDMPPIEIFEGLDFK